MKYASSLRWMLPLIGVLAAIAAAAGLFWQTEGQPYRFTSVQGEVVTIAGSGLYRYDTVSTVAQMRANDLVTLILALPLLIVSGLLAFRGSLRGRLLLAGTLGFFLYTYMSMCVGTSYNPLFLVYAALFGLSLYAFILTMLSFDVSRLPQAFSERLPRRGIAGVLFAGGGFLALAWLGRIAATFAPGAIPPLENTTTMFIQAMDLVLIAPLCVLGGILLLRRNAWGYLLASVAVMKILTMGTAVSLMAVNMVLAGTPASPVELLVFPTLTMINLGMAVLLLRDVRVPR